MADLIDRFELTIQDVTGLFANSMPLEPSAGLAQWMEDNLNLAIAINTKKARSELIIAPIPIEVRRHHLGRLSLFSGIEFSVDATQGLTGVCDFWLSQSPEQLFVRAPGITLVEAKNENLKYF